MNIQEYSIDQGQSSLTKQLIRGTGMGGGIGSVLYDETVDSGSISKTEYFSYNAVGSTMATLNAENTLTSTNYYDSFGNVVCSTGDSDNNRKFCTKERSSYIGLDNFGFRYFDPILGRFIQRDPAGYPDGPNNYLYCHNNPINFVDPLGLEEASDSPGLWDYVKAATDCVQDEIRERSGQKQHEGTIFKKIGDTAESPNDLKRKKIARERIEKAKEVYEELAPYVDDPAKVVKDPIKKEINKKLNPKKNKPKISLTDPIISGGETKKQTPDPVEQIIEEAVDGTVDSATQTEVEKEKKKGKPVTNGERGTYQDLKKRSVKNDGLDIHEMPSYASRVKAAEKKLGRPLSTKEKAKLRKTGPAIAIKKSLHKKTGSYGGKNTKKNIEADAANQDAASKRDNAEVDKLLEDDRKK